MIEPLHTLDQPKACGVNGSIPSWAARVEQRWKGRTAGLNLLCLATVGPPVPAHQPPVANVCPVRGMKCMESILYAQRNQARGEKGFDYMAEMQFVYECFCKL